MSLFVWGSGRGGQLGLEAPEKDTKWCLRTPAAVDIGGSVKAVDVACGEGHTVLVTEYGEVVSCGRNKEGQLGRSGRELLGMVQGLEAEVAAGVACGAFHTAVWTAAGRVYEFGLCHSTAQSRGNEQEETTTSGAAPAVELRTTQNDSVLERIVRDSTERWLLGGDEPVGRGEEDDAVLLDRAGLMTDEERAATIGLARMDCARVRIEMPRLVESLARITILEVACGYGHSLARSSQGRCYSSGYNDRGQLGLGHRATSSEYVLVRSLADVRRVACGAQHSLVVATDMLFAFGQGALGQLGLGRRVTGRTSPVRVPVERVTACAAGANHSIAVDDQGGAWFWGHAEYGQHGGLENVSFRDYVDPEYFCVPRRVQPAPPPLKDVTCGANFTLGITTSGGLVSWGWPAQGALGRGIGSLVATAAPDHVLGLAADVATCAAGTRHAAAVASDSRCPHGLRLAALLKTSDVVQILIDGSPDQSVPAQATLLGARSRYFRGLLKHVLDDDERTLELPSSLGGADLTIPMLKAIVTYLATDRLDAPPHRLAQLADVATALLLPDLAAMCRGQRPPSTFAADMAGLVDDPFASDVELELGRDGTVIRAHTVLLETADYFAALLHFTAKNRTEEEEESRIKLDDWGGPDGLVTTRDAKNILMFVYAGPDALEHLKDDPDALLHLIIAADLVRLPLLVRFAERHLVLLIRDDPHAAAVCLDFAQRFDFLTRLDRAASDVLDRVM